MMSILKKVFKNSVCRLSLEISVNNYSQASLKIMLP
jgi:hypothetical protein